MNLIHRQAFSILLLLLFFWTSSTSILAQTTEKTWEQKGQGIINHEDIIQQGLTICAEQYPSSSFRSTIQYFQNLERWYTMHPLIEFASLLGNTMTVKFIDSSYLVLLDVFADTDPQTIGETLQPSDLLCSPFPSPDRTVTGQTAVLLNPSEYLYGSHHCKKIMDLLMRRGYSLVYRANTDVDISYLRHNLTAAILYMDTHAGYWDLDGDHQSDTVIIATGEDWTNETPQQYSFEYEHHFIVEGIVGQRSVIAFTPAFIEYYYTSHNFPASLVYMATCYASYDDSMATAFLATGAHAYMGWTQNTVFWTNSRTSVLAFRLFTAGFTTKQVCTLIRSGGVYNWLFQSKLMYYGDGSHRIPRE